MSRRFSLQAGFLVLALAVSAIFSQLALAKFNVYYVGALGNPETIPNNIVQDDAGWSENYYNHMISYVGGFRCGNCTVTAYMYYPNHTNACAAAALTAVACGFGGGYAYTRASCYGSSAVGSTLDATCYKERN
jgi:hypothetical protein